MNNTLTDLKRLLDSGETLMNDKGDKIKKVHHEYWYVPNNGAAYPFRINEGIVPSEWRQRDQIGAEKQPEQIAFDEFKKVPDDGLFPNHSDKDIWVSGFKAGYEYAMKNRF